MSHEQLLQQFKEITSTSEDELAISILESVNWNVETAIHSFFENGFTPTSQPSQPPQSFLEANAFPEPGASSISDVHPAPSFRQEYRDQELDFVQPLVDDDTAGISLGTTPYFEDMPRPQPIPQPVPASGQSSELRTSPVTSDANHHNIPNYSRFSNHPTRRYLHFLVKFDKNSEEIALPETDTVADLKKQIENRLRISLQSKKLAGWRGLSPSDDATLESLHLPKYNDLRVVDSPNSETTISKHQVVAYNPEPTQPAKTFSEATDLPSCVLAISFTSNGKPDRKELIYPFSKTVEEVKMDIYILTKIQVRQQKWTGWPSPPSNCDWVRRQQRNGDSVQLDLNLPPAPFTDQRIKLKDLQLNLPIHELQVEKLPEAAKKDRHKASSKSHILSADVEADSGRDRRGHRQHQPPPYDSAAAVGEGETDSAAATGSASSDSKSPSSIGSDAEIDPPRFSSTYGADMEDEQIETDVYQPGIGVDMFDYLNEEDEQDADERARRNANSEPLMPPNCYDEVLAISAFTDNFKMRYGHSPSFFAGTLQDAIKAAFHQQRATERKPLVIYLHHNQSIFSNIICQNVLGDPQILKKLDETCVVWPWDVTETGNRTRLLASINKQHPDLSSSTVPFAIPLDYSIDELDNTPQTSVAGRILARLRSLPSPDECPLVFVIIKKRVPVGLEGLPGAGPGSAAPPDHWTPSIVYEGTGPAITTKELSAKIDDAFNTYRAMLWSDIESEMKREENQRLRDTQREEYEASVRADREKDRRRQQQADEKKRLEEREAEEKRKREEQEAKMKRTREEICALAKRKLLPEPSPSERSGTICTIKFMLPNDAVPLRRFALNSAADQLFCFLAAEHNLMPSEIKLLMQFPKREYVHKDSHMKTIAELGFSATERINVQIIDSDIATM